MNNEVRGFAWIAEPRTDLIVTKCYAPVYGVSRIAAFIWAISD